MFPWTLLALPLPNPLKSQPQSSQHVSDEKPLMLVLLLHWVRRSWIFTWLKECLVFLRAKKNKVTSHPHNEKWGAAPSHLQWALLDCLFVLFFFFSNLLKLGSDYFASKAFARKEANSLFIFFFFIFQRNRCMEGHLCLFCEEHGTWESRLVWDSWNCRLAAGGGKRSIAFVKNKWELEEILSLYWKWHHPRSLQH